MTGHEDRRVSVIIPTEAHVDRGPSLLRAIDTVVTQRGVQAIPIVVVNGSRRDAQILHSLGCRRDLRLVTLEEGSLPGALRAGRALVDTPWFAVLDDDDELLPDALSVKVEVLAGDPAVGAVVTNGFIETGGQRTLNISDFSGFEADPLRALLRHHWLPPCAGLFRTDAAILPLFARIPAYLEWTYLAVAIALHCRVRFLSRPTFVYHADTPASLSKSRQSLLAQPAALARVLQLDVPADVRAHFEASLTMAYHEIATMELHDGHRAAAWWSHVKSLTGRRGWRHALYTRRLLYATARGRDLTRSQVG
jgi:hypothetical protein